MVTVDLLANGLISTDLKRAGGAAWVAAIDKPVGVAPLFPHVQHPGQSAPSMQKQDVADGLRTAVLVRSAANKMVQRAVAMARARGWFKVAISSLLESQGSVSEAWPSTSSGVGGLTTRRKAVVLRSPEIPQKPSASRRY